MKFYFTVLILLVYATQNLHAEYTHFEDSLIQVIDSESNNYKKLDAYFNLVDEFYMTGEIQKGDGYFQQMENFIAKNQIESGKGYLSLLTSYKAFYHENNVSAGISEILLSIQQLEAATDTSIIIKRKLASALSETGYYYRYVGLYDKALDYYLQSLKYAETNACDKEVMKVYNYLFFLYSEHFNDDEKGLDYLYKSLEIAKRLNDRKYEDILNGNIAMLHIKMGDLEKGGQYVKKVIAARQQWKDSIGLAHIYLEEARLFLNLDDLENAAQSIDKCFTFIPEKCDWCYQVNITAGQVAKKKQNYKEAEQFFLTAKSIVEQTGNLSGKYWVLLDLAKLAKDRNQSQKAVGYYSEMYVIKDSLENQWAISNAMNIQTQKEINSIEEEKQRLAFDKELNVAKIKSQQKSITFIALLFVVALASGVIIFIQKTNLLKAYRILVQKNRLLLATAQKSQEKSNELKVEINTEEQIKQQQEEELLHKLKTELFEKMQTALEEDKIFLDSDLTLLRFAQHLNTNTAYLSKLINNIYNKRFSLLINEYRIKEVLLYFETDQVKDLTILALAQKAGFNSKSAFNSAFKNYTGVTPSFYLKSQKSLNNS